MAMDPNVMGAAVAAAVQANKPPAGTAQTVEDLEIMWIAICTEIIAEIASGGITSTEVTAGSSAGTYPGTIS